MQPLDPITLAIIAVVIALVLSALLLLLFATREEKYEDVLAAQRSEEEAYLARTASAKPVKQRKKMGKGKKKYSDEGEVLEEISSSQVEETIEASASIADDEGFLPSDEYSKDRPGTHTDENTPLAEEKPSSGALKERQGKKKAKKNVPKEEVVSVTERHSFERPREDVVEVATEVDVVATLESEPDKPVDFEIEEQKFPDSNGTVTSGKKAKAKPKITKDKGAVQQGELRLDYMLWCRIIFLCRLISILFPMSTDETDPFNLPALINFYRSSRSGSEDFLLKWCSLNLNQSCALERMKSQRGRSGKVLAKES